MKLERLDHLDLVVSDISRSVAFYQKFGLVVQGTIDDGQTVFLWNQDETKPMVVELHQAEEGQSPGLGHVAFYVDDVEGAYAELSKAGVRFDLRPQHNADSGRTIAQTIDPDGIPIQLAKKTTRGAYEDHR